MTENRNVDNDLKAEFRDYLLGRIEARRARSWQHASDTLIAEIARGGAVLSELTGDRVGWTLNRGNKTGVANWPTVFTLTLWCRDDNGGKKMCSTLNHFYIRENDEFPIMVTEASARIFLANAEAIRTRMHVYFFDPGSDLVSMLDLHSVVAK